MTPAELDEIEARAKAVTTGSFIPGAILQVWRWYLRMDWPGVCE